MPDPRDFDTMTLLSASKGDLALCLQRMENAEARLKTEFANVEGILQEVRSIFVEMGGEGSVRGETDVKVSPDVKSIEIIGDEEHVETIGDEALVAGAKPPSELVLDVHTELMSDDLAVKNENVFLALSTVRDEVAEGLGLAPEEVSRAYQVFLACDGDNSGKLESAEARIAIEKLNGRSLDRQEYVQIMAAFDTDADCALSFEEFLFLYCHTPEKKLNHLAKFSSHVRFKGNRLSSNFRALVGGVKTSHVKEYVREEVTEMAACLKLPAVILTFAIFFMSCQLHRNSGTIARASEYAVKYHVEENANFGFSGAIPFENGRMGHKNMYDVNTAADFWSWFGIGLVPLLFPAPGLSETRVNLAGRCTPPADALFAAGFPLNGTDFPASAYLMNDLGSICQQQPQSPMAFTNLGRHSPFLSTQSILAGLRLQQEQLPVSQCSQPDLLGHAFEGSCTGSGKAWIEPEMNNVMGMDRQLTDKPGASTEYFLSQTPQQEVLRHVMALENSAWINQRTSKVEILFTTYNPDTRMLTALRIYFTFNRAGHINKFIKPTMLDLTPYWSPFLYIVDALFLMSLVQIAFDESRMLIRMCKIHGLRDGSFRYFGFSQIVNWVIIALTASVGTHWVQDCFARLQLLEYLHSGDTNIPGTWTKPVDRFNFYNLVDICLRSSEQYQLVLGMYTLCLGLRFFEAYSGQPRLALVTNTLRASFIDVIHFGVVVGSVLLVFSLSAQILFGWDLDNFGSFDRSVMTLFKSMTDSLDTSKLKKMDHTLCASWDFAFTALIELLMLNMLLAIILDTYSQVKSSIPPDAETFWSQAYEIFTRWRDRRLGRRISLQTVMDFLESEACSKEYLTVPVLVQSVPGLGEPQALMILKQADGRVDELNLKSAGEGVSQQVTCIDMRIQQLQQLMSALAERTQLSEDPGAAVISYLRKKNLLAEAKGQ